MRKRGWGEEGLQVIKTFHTVFSLLWGGFHVSYICQVRLNMGSGRRGLFTLGLGNHRATAPSTLSSGIGSRWVERCSFYCAKSVAEELYSIWNNFKVRSKERGTRLLNLHLNPKRCDTPELDWSGGEDEDGGLRSTSRLFLQNSVFFISKTSRWHIAVLYFSD